MFCTVYDQDWNLSFLNAVSFLNEILFSRNKADYLTGRQTWLSDLLVVSDIGPHKNQVQKKKKRFVD